MKEVHLHRDAPPKPAVGAACNGCGVCCSLAPCPLSRWLLGHRAGTCPALRWQDGRYVCGLVVAPRTFLNRLPAFCVPVASRLAYRWIAAGSGCDCDAEPE
ncbi:MAG: hypothetical protein RBS28_09120 [Rhodocyclaceae bacterium]|jgi:hypothetical protein|nr:hypothetical protein [Rhodocyclaceae bacterium]